MIQHPKHVCVCVGVCERREEEGGKLSWSFSNEGIEGRKGTGREAEREGRGGKGRGRGRGREEKTGKISLGERRISSGEIWGRDITRSLGMRGRRSLQHGWAV